MSWSKEALVDRQVKEWLAKKEASRNQVKVKPFHRAITVTGDFGALSYKLAEVLSQQLRYRLYDREIIEMIAQRAQVDSYLVEQVETEKQSYLQEIFESLLGNRTINDSGYLRRLTEVIGAIGHDGSAVVVGRGANIILGAERALRIRCVAPMTLRVQRNSRRLCLTIKEAEAETKKEDARRTQWVQDLLGVDPTDANNYDLVLSTGQFSIDQAASIVLRSHRAIGGDRRGMPVKMLKSKAEQPEEREAPALWLNRRS